MEKGSMSSNGVFVPRKMMMDMLKAYYKMEQAIASMEIMMDTDTMKNIKKSKKEVREGKSVRCSIDELDSVLK